MSNSKSNNKSTAAQQAAAKAQQAQARLAQAKNGKAAAATPNNVALLENPMYFANLDPSSVMVREDKKKGGKLYVEFNTGANGRASGNTRKNSTAPYLADMLLSASSRCAGEGNVGVKYEKGEFTRGSCKYSLSLRVGTTADGAGGDELLERQEACLKWVFDVACAAMGKVFDMKPKGWEAPIDNARADARRDLWRSIKGADGKPLEDEVALEALIASETAAGKAAATRVEAAAREAFIKQAIKNKRMPCAPIYHEQQRTQVIGRNDLHAHGKVYGYIQWVENHPHRTSTGPLLSELTSSIENWAAIKAQMEQIGRVYQYAYRLIPDIKANMRPMVKVLMDELDPVTAERIKVLREIQDPFWNPLLETPKGRKLDSLVAMQITFTIKRGTDNSGFGVGVQYQREIRVVHQQPRPIEQPEYAPSYGTGLFRENADDDDDAAPEEGEVVAAAFEPAVAVAKDEGEPADAANEAGGDAEEDQEGQESYADEDAAAAAEEEQPQDEVAEEDGEQAEENEVGDADAEEDGDADADEEAEAARLAAEEEAARLAAEEAERASKAKAAKRKTAPAGKAAAAATADDKRARK